MERIIIIENEELKPILEKKQELVDKGRALHKEWIEIEAALKKKTEAIKALTEEIGALQGEVVPLMGPIEEKVREENEFGDYEVVNSVGIEDGKITLKIVDELEFYRIQVLDKKYAKPTDTESSDEGETQEDDDQGKAGESTK